MQAYGAAKSKLFDWPTLAVRVLNIDDPLVRLWRPGRRRARGWY